MFGSGRAGESTREKGKRGLNEGERYPGPARFMTEQNAATGYIKWTS